MARRTIGFAVEQSEAAFGRNADRPFFAADPAIEWRIVRYDRAFESRQCLLEFRHRDVAFAEAASKPCT